MCLALIALLFIDIFQFLVLILSLFTTQLSIVGIVMYWMQINFSSESSAGLIFIPLIAFDYAIHMAFGLRIKREVEDEEGEEMRDETSASVYAVSEVGTSLLCGGCTVALGMVVTFCFAISPINLVFAVIFLTTIGIAAFMYLLVVPSLTTKWCAMPKEAGVDYEKIEETEGIQ